jgi:hypothetical protein
MSIKIKINTVERADIVQNSISWDQELTKDPSVLSFEITNKGQSMPALGDAVVLEIGGVAKFTGTLTNKNSEIRSGLVEKFTFEAKDGFHAFDHRLVIKAYTSQSASDIVSDIIANFTDGFTDTNVVAGAPTITTIRFNYEQPSQAMKMICNAIGWDWYIDANLDVHFFPQNYNVAPFSITDDNGNLINNSLEISRDILSLKNAIYVRGGEFSTAISEANSFDKYVSDGTQITFPLVYRYKNVEVTVNGVAQTVGVDFITDPATVDCVYNFNEKAVKFPDASKPTAGQIVRVFGDAQIPLIVQAVDETSILAYGRFEHVLIDKSIESTAEAELQALSIMNDYASASYEGRFQTLTEGLQAGQYIAIQSSSRAISGTFKITSINAKPYDADSFIYTVKFLKSGQFTFFDMLTDMLAEKRKNIVISEDEIISRIVILPETMAITDEIISKDTTSAPYTWQDPSQAPEANPIVWNFFTWQ